MGSKRPRDYGRDLIRTVSMAMPAHAVRVLLLFTLPLVAAQAQARPWPQPIQAPIPIPMDAAPWPSDGSALTMPLPQLAASELSLCPAPMRDALTAAGRGPSLLFQRSCTCYAQQRRDGAIEPLAVRLCLP